MTLDVDCADFDADAELAAQYGVDAALITLDIPAGVCRRSRARAPGPSRSWSRSPPGHRRHGEPIRVDADLVAVETVDDSALGSALGTALGATVTVARPTSPRRRSPRRSPSTAPRARGAPPASSSRARSIPTTTSRARTLRRASSARPTHTPRPRRRRAPTTASATTASTASSAPRCSARSAPGTDCRGGATLERLPLSAPSTARTMPPSMCASAPTQTPTARPWAAELRLDERLPRRRERGRPVQPCSPADRRLLHEVCTTATWGGGRPACPQRAAARAPRAAKRAEKRSHRPSRSGGRWPVFFCRSSWCAAGTPNWCYIDATYSPTTKAKILLTIYMIATKVDTVYSVSMPQEVRRRLVPLAHHLPRHERHRDDAARGLAGYVPSSSG